MSQTTIASVTQFEQAVQALDFELACNELLNILSQLDHNFGNFDTIECNYPPQLTTLPLEKTQHFCHRVATAITQLFDARHSFGISEQGFMRFMTLHRWIHLIFASSSYVNADHILYTFAAPEHRQATDLHLPDDINVWRKFCILYTPESTIQLNLDTLWQVSPQLCAALCFALQSPRFIGTDQAFEKRGTILQWFPEKLAQIESLEQLPANITHDVYMHCSYDIAANKHQIKESVNQVIRRHLLAHGWHDLEATTFKTKQQKPVMFVVLEHFHSSHSIYRTHSTSLIAAKAHFHLVGFGTSAVDEVGRAVFDEFFVLDKPSVFENIHVIREVAEQMQPAIVYMPSIGMDLTTIFLSNTKLAPIQAVALGHPATTHSPFIDYVIVEDDYVGSESCFSEQLIRLPKDALPYVPSALAPQHIDYRLRPTPEVVQIGIASTTMKLNPYFLQALKAIRDRSQVKVHFHFALGQSIGITHPYVSRFIKSYLGDDATAHPHASYHEYLSNLHACDMMLNPFPFGNTNGIIDMVTLGLVGICKTGAEVHEHIDEGLFKRLGLPDWLIATTVDDYVERAIRLAENHDERLALRHQIIENNGLNTLFSGNPAPMGEAFLAKLTEWQTQQNPPKKENVKTSSKRTSKRKTKQR